MTQRQVDNDNGLLTIAEAQERLHVGKTKIYALHKEGRLELVKFDRGTRVTEQSVRKLEREIARKQLVRP